MPTPTPAAKPIPKPTPETQMFWDKALEGELWLQRTVKTKQAYFPPRPFFPTDPTQEVEWFKASGKVRERREVRERVAAKVVAVAATSRKFRRSRTIRRRGPAAAVVRFPAPACESMFSARCHRSRSRTDP